MYICMYYIDLIGIGKSKIRFMSDLVGNPEDRFSHNEAQIIIGITEKKGRIKIDERCGEKQWYRSACASQKMRPKLKLRELLFSRWYMWANFHHATMPV